MSRTPADLVTNILTMRSQLLRSMIDPRRNIDIECGHPSEINMADYSLSYERGDVAARVVALYPEETWVQPPTIYETEDETETEFETAWKELNRDKALISYLKRVDVLSGIGRFGVLLMGISDGRKLNEPIPNIDATGAVTGTEKLDLLYLRTFDESVISIVSLETDVSNPRYGMPLMYRIQFVENSVGIAVSTESTVTLDVHWSRVIHVADNRHNSEIFGLPRMQKVYNRLLDLKKVAGGGGEMFWKGGFPGLSLQSLPGLNPTDLEFDETKTKEQMQNYQEGLQRYIATIGMDVKSLTVQVADPTPHILVQLKLIATAMSVPWRIFVGAEVGQLSSDQDTENWSKRIGQRRADYVNPFLIRPFVDRLITIGALPQPKKPKGYLIDWPDLQSPSAKDKAEVADKQANAIAKYLQAGADILIPPFHFLTLVLDFSIEEAAGILQAAGIAPGDMLPMPALPAPAPGAKAKPGDTPAATAGRRNGILNPANNEA